MDLQLAYIHHQVRAQLYGFKALSYEKFCRMSSKLSVYH